MIWIWIVMMGTRERLLGMRGRAVGVDGVVLGEVGQGAEADLVTEEGEAVVEEVEGGVDLRRRGGV